MGNKYLITLDGSDNSKYSLSWALENLIDPKNDSLLLLSVGVLSASTPYEYSAVTRDIFNNDSEIKLERQQVEKRAKEIVSDGKNMITEYFATRGQEEIPLNVESFVSSSPDPAKYIVDLSREQKVDVLVMGHRGTSSGAANIGTVSQYCIHSAGCTVVITKKTKNQS